MGYLFTPSQQEKDNAFINNTLQDLKTINLLKQAQEGAARANAIPLDSSIPQSSLTNTQPTQTQHTQSNTFGTNLIKQPIEPIAAPQQVKPQQWSNQLALSSNKDFNPTQNMQDMQQTQAQPQKTN